jgi:NADPH:quinone reductase-like Zn-dependent oxidoreductase
VARIIRFHEFGGPEVLKIEEADIVPPGPGEVQIKVEAIGLNRAEAMLRAGVYGAPTFPTSLGYEAAGTIHELGKGVEGLAVGDAVSVIPPQAMMRWSSYAEFATFPAELVVRHPANLNMKEAAASWMQYATAYGGLIEIAELAEGDHVVVTAASSSVGVAAIQIANCVGATPIAVTRSRRKAEELTKIGAREVVVVEEEDVTERILAMTERRGARVVFECVGGSMFQHLTAAMATHGVLVQYGLLTGFEGEPTPLPLQIILGKSLIIRGYRFSEVVNDPERRVRAKQFILDGMRQGKLRPLIAKEFPFEQIADAHRYLESNEQIGKVIVTV